MSTAKLISFVALLAGLPVALYLVMQTVRVRPKAVVADSQFYFAPSTTSLPPNRMFDVRLDAETNQILFVRTEFTFDKTKEQLASEIQTNPAFGSVISKSTMAGANTAGKVVVVLGLCDPLQNDCDPLPPAPTGDFSVATFTMTAVTSQQTTDILTFDPTHIQVVDVSTSAVPVTTTNATLTLNPVSATPTPTPTPCVPPPPPTNISPSSNTTCGLTDLTFSWNGSAGAINYPLRINDQSDIWPGANDTLIDVDGTSYTRSVVPGRTYEWWVHSSNGVCYSAAVGATITVPICPTPTPTVTPTPTPTPTITPTPTPTEGADACAYLFDLGDANEDGAVDGIDYVRWLNHYLENTTSMPVAQRHQVGDFNRDGVVDGVDYVRWLNHYLENCVVGATPTPTPPSDSIAHVQTVTGGSSSSTTVSTSTPITAVSGQVYLAAISVRGPYTGPATVSSVSGLELIWTKVDGQCGGRNQTSVEVWKGSGTPTGSGAVTATVNTPPSNLVIAVSRYAGASDIGNVTSANANGVNGACSGGTDTASYSVNLPVITNSMAYGAVALREKTHTPGTGFIEISEIHQGSGGDTVGIAAENRLTSSATTISLNGTLSNLSDWAVVAVEIKTP